jgi:4-hydroxy 2-oxovalerate aldolase
LKISKKNIFNISNNSCEIPIPLVIIYTLAIVLTGKAKRIYVAGFDGFKDNNPNIDETNYLLNIFRKKYQLPTLKTITKSRYKISQLKI